jgi:hypothetical protein
MEAEDSPETLVTTYETRRRGNLEEHNLNFHLHENIASDQSGFCSRHGARCSVVG